MRKVQVVQRHAHDGTAENDPGGVNPADEQQTGEDRQRDRNRVDDAVDNERFGRERGRRAQDRADDRGVDADERRLDEFDELEAAQPAE